MERDREHTRMQLSVIVRPSCVVGATEALLSSAVAECWCLFALHGVAFVRTPNPNGVENPNSLARRNERQDEKIARPSTSLKLLWNLPGMLWKQEEDEEVEENCPIRIEGVVIKTRKLRHNFTAFGIAMIPRETQLQTLSRRLYEEKVISQTDVMMKRNSTRIMLILVTAQPVKSPFSATSHSRLHVFLLLLTSQRENWKLGNSRQPPNFQHCKTSMLSIFQIRNPNALEASQNVSIAGYKSDGKDTYSKRNHQKKIALAWN